jgi:hypothetical protein
VGSGVAASALARRFAVPAAEARLSGAIFAFSPYAFAHLYVGHMELLSTLWLPLGLWLFLRLIEAPAPRLRDGFSLGLAFVACAYVTQYYAVYLAELLSVVALFRLRSILRAAVLEALLLAGAVAALGVTPIAVAFLSLESGSLPPNPIAFDSFAGDLTGFLIPSFTHPLFGTWLRLLHERLNPGPLPLPQETTVFVGATVLFLAARGFRQLRKTGRPAFLLATIAVVFGVLALGAHLKIAGLPTGIPLPAELLSRIPVLRLARAPGRHIVVATLVLGILAGAGQASLARTRLRWLAIVLVALEYVAAPLPLFSLDPGPVYARLAATRGDFAVLELPLEMRDGQSLLGLPNHEQALGQTLHGRPTVGGMVSRLPSDTLRALTAAPVVGTILDPVGATQAATERDRREGSAWFRTQHVAAVVVHPPLVGGPQERYLRWVLGPVDQQDFEDGTRLLWIQSSASAVNR